MKGSSLGLYFDPRGAGSTPARDKAFFLSYPFVSLVLIQFLCPSIAQLFVEHRIRPI